MANTPAAPFRIEVAVEPCDDLIRLRLVNASAGPLTLPSGFRLVCFIGEYLPCAPIKDIRCRSVTWTPSETEPGVLMLSPVKTVTMPEGGAEEIVLAGVAIPNEVVGGHFHIEASGFTPPVGQPETLAVMVRSAPPSLPFAAQLLGTGCVPADGKGHDLRLRIFPTGVRRMPPVKIAVDVQSSHGYSCGGMTLASAFPKGAAWGLNNNLLTPPAELSAGKATWAEVTISNFATTSGVAAVVLTCPGEVAALRLPFILTANVTPPTVSVQSGMSRTVADGRVFHLYEGGQAGVEVTVAIDAKPAMASALCWRIDRGPWTTVAKADTTFRLTLAASVVLEVIPSVGWRTNWTPVSREIAVAAIPTLLKAGVRTTPDTEPRQDIVVKAGTQVFVAWSATCEHRYTVTVGGETVADGKAKDGIAFYKNATLHGLKATKEYRVTAFHVDSAVGSEEIFLARGKVEIISDIKQVTYITHDQKEYLVIRTNGNDISQVNIGWSGLKFTPISSKTWPKADRLKYNDNIIYIYEMRIKYLLSSYPLRIKGNEFPILVSPNHGSQYLIHPVEIRRDPDEPDLQDLLKRTPPSLRPNRLSTQLLKRSPRRG